MHILDALVLHEDSARYASICRAWQTMIERRTFAHLKVTRARLAGFSDIGYRHRHLVKNIWFSIEPSEFLCPRCDGARIPNWHQLPTETISRAIQDLVIQLSTWEPNGSLLLDISVKAPSGLMHSSSTIQYGSDLISDPKKAKTIQCSNLLHDTDFWLAGLRRKITNVDKLEPVPSQKMPKARAVTSLLLRRQTRRPWKSEELVELLDLLPEVHEIHYEPWRDWRRMEERPTNTSKAQDTLL